MPEDALQSPEAAFTPLVDLGIVDQLSDQLLLDHTELSIAFDDESHSRVSAVFNQHASASWEPKTSKIM